MFAFKIVMDYRMRYIVFVCPLTFSEILTFISTAEISFTKYHYEPSLAGNRCGPNDTVFEMDNVFDPLQCGKLCSNGNMCRSVFYQPDSHTCIGCRFSTKVRTCLEPFPGTEYFRSEPTYYYTNQEKYTDCKDIYDRCNVTSGLYDIFLWKSKKQISVFCDMDTDGGGWTVFQNRFDGSTDFYRDFSDYENGFGELSGEFWLGLKVLQEMTFQGKTELRLDLTAADDTTGYETFQNFYLGESPSYSLRIGSMTGTMGDDTRPGLSQNDGGNFTTYDTDRDTESSYNMANETGSGWWHIDRRTVHANLNGEYITPGTIGQGQSVGIYGMYYYKFKSWYSLKSSKMMFRRINKI